MEEKQPASDEATHVKEEMRKSGFMIGVGGRAKNVLRLQPPLVITKQEIGEGADALEAALRRPGS